MSYAGLCESGECRMIISPQLQLFINLWPKLIQDATNVQKKT